MDDLQQIQEVDSDKPNNSVISGLRRLFIATENAFQPFCTNGNSLRGKTCIEHWNKTGLRFNCRLSCLLWNVSSCGSHDSPFDGNYLLHPLHCHDVQIVYPWYRQIKVLNSVSSSAERRNTWPKHVSTVSCFYISITRQKSMQKHFFSLSFFSFMYLLVHFFMYLIFSFFTPLHGCRVIQRIQ